MQIRFKGGKILQCKKDGEEIVNERVTIVKNTMYISNIALSDDGLYTCNLEHKRKITVANHTLIVPG